MNVTRFETTLPSGHTLRLRRGDLTEEAVDAIVNAANTQLQHGAGVAWAIVCKGGQVIQEESNKKRLVPTGGAVLTGGGNLRARFVIHAVGPIYKSYPPAESARLLASYVTAALEVARERGLTGIAIPPISSGIFGYPVTECACILTDAVCSWAEDHPGDNPRDIRFTILEPGDDSEKMRAFKDELEARFGKNNAEDER